MAALSDDVDRRTTEQIFAQDAEELRAVLDQRNNNRSFKRFGKISYQDDDSLDQWTSIRVLKYKFRGEKSDEVALTDIVLPLPLNLETGYQQQWTDLDDISAGIGQIFNNREAIGNSVSDLINQLQGISSKENPLTEAANIIKRFASGNSEAASLATNLLMNPTIAGTAAGTLAGLTGLATGSATRAAALAIGAGAIFAPVVRGFGINLGIAANRYQTVAYEKPQLRQHQFNWNLIARDQEQSKKIQKIIYALKYHSSPDNRGEIFGYFNYPELFSVNFGPEFNNKNLFNISPSVMSSFNVNYHGTGRPLYHFEDKTPLSVNISMTLQEITVVTKQNIEKDNR